MKHELSNNQVHLFTVNNDDEGRKFIADFRKNVRRSKQKVRIIQYGRGHRFGLGRSKWVGGQFIHGNDYQSHIPLSKAQTIAVYVKGPYRRPFPQI